MRYDARSDANQQDIIDALRAIGATDTSLHRVGQGVPDLICGFRGVNVLLEVKTATGKLTADEAFWIDDWRGQAAIVRNVGEAITVLEDLTT